MKKILLSGLVLLATTGVAFAQNVDFSASPDYPNSINYSNTNTQNTQSSGNSGGVSDLNSLVRFIISTINTAIYLIIAGATVVFIWNIVKYFVVQTEGDRAEAAKYLMYSVIGLAVIFSFWGLVNVVIKTFSLENNQRPNIQSIKPL